ncbi:50S ribosomal protein L21 [Candidatus Falkowbacteria bacterium]|uniref:Large ribosomal subunit protein bL21 n=1 Tax=Candidatus Buchananbacteria bacterium CG10_big_fil_rev_8_21_14_0_10_33_19 TaxID=1974525 RepID=A0A2H0W3U0_9BACT|nr:50S ribosomal protein L21 [Candidatus Falkowbacteria bacterium]PIS06016.1 MAG: 50S ribosomal protein L21 [Candidatus Buchananbacteria bacterium CG10_big_fil_rev_8_21_14_0_10_33_19]
MKIAVIKTGGKQYVVKEKDKIKIEKLKVETGDKVEFDTLLLVDGDKMDLGAPLLKSKVEGKVLAFGKARKVTGVKYKPKTRQAKKFGHRQEFVEVEINKI